MAVLESIMFMFLGFCSPMTFVCCDVDMIL